MMVARWSIDARFGYTQNVIDLMQGWLWEIAPQAGFSLGAGQHESAYRNGIQFRPVKPYCASIHRQRLDPVKEMTAHWAVYQATANRALEPTAASGLRSLAVPSSLCSSAAAQRER